MNEKSQEKPLNLAARTHSMYKSTISFWGFFIIIQTLSPNKFTSVFIQFKLFMQNRSDHFRTDFLSINRNSIIYFPYKHWNFPNEIFYPNFFFFFICLNFSSVVYSDVLYKRKHILLLHNPLLIRRDIYVIF